jgi:hypothetical protein
MRKSSSDTRVSLLPSRGEIDEYPSKGQNTMKVCITEHAAQILAAIAGSDQRYDPAIMARRAWELAEAFQKESELRRVKQLKNPPPFEPGDRVLLIKKITQQQGEPIDPGVEGEVESTHGGDVLVLLDSGVRMAYSMERAREYFERIPVRLSFRTLLAERPHDPEAERKWLADLCADIGLPSSKDREQALTAGTLIKCLAAVTPHKGSLACYFCGTTTSRMGIGQHDPACLWRMAKEWTAAGGEALLRNILEALQSARFDLMMQRLPSLLWMVWDRGAENGDCRYSDTRRLFDDPEKAHAYAKSRGYKGANPPTKPHFDSFYIQHPVDIHILCLSTGDQETATVPSIATALRNVGPRPMRCLHGAPCCDECWRADETRRSRNVGPNLEDLVPS